MDPTIVTTETSVPQSGILFFRPFASGGSFTLTAGGSEIRKSAVRGAGATVLAQGSGIAIQIVSTLVLARLLTPADFGLVTMVTTFSLLAMNAGGNGLTEALLQRKDLNHALASNIFWINITTGLALTILFASAGGLMAKFYHNPLVAPVAIGLSFTILITSVSVIHLALLMRAMRFPIVYANQIFARCVSVVASIIFAKAGWGYWALVIGAVAQPVSECTGAWIFCRWVPGLPKKLPGTMSIVRFGLHVYGRFSFNYFARNTDNLLVGWRFNAQSLGFYKKAYDLFAMSTILQSFTPVAVAALSRLYQDLEKYKRHLLSAVSVWSFLGMGVGGAVTLVGKDVIRVLLGPKWEPAGVVFTFFGPGFGIMFIYGIHGWIHLSIGRPGRWFKWAIIEFVVTFTLFLVALPWGPAGVATSWSVSLLILTLPALWYAGKPINLGIAPMIRAIWRFVAATLVAGFVSVLIFGGLASFADPKTLTNAVLQIVERCLLFGVLYIATVAALHWSFAPLHQVVGLLQEMLSASGKTAPAVAAAVAETVAVAGEK